MLRVGFGCFGGQARAEKMAEDGYPVKLHIYDLSQGMARQLSATILGKAIEGIWHTGVVVYGREYYFGGGIQQGQPGRTPYGTPVRAVDLGVTHVPREMFEDFLREIGPRYTPATYNLLTHNCNNFSNEAAQFLAGTTVPSFILELPKEVMNSPVGALILPMIQGLDTSLRAGAVPQPPQLRPTPSQGAIAATTATATQPSANGVEARSTAADKPENGKTADNGVDKSIMGVPTAVQPAPVATATMTRPLKDDVEQGSAAAGKPEDGETPDNGATLTRPSADNVDQGLAAAGTPEEGQTAGNGDDDDNGSTAVPPSVQSPAPPTTAAQVSAVPAVVATKASPPDPLAEAKSRVQEEIRREFAAIMAAGTARPGEAAALATRRVMERHGLRRAAVAAQRG
ncbi:hypothetical protein HU200_049451 [Digitaria exilis]|uniref:PPPDE domain-containing protein n=1 Tax=Digitaria exilis TaxID=1010633 RepID=A0A835AU41_9POAL|nr:hypothetical protein HU200_049451 [Digitaria exilis]